jgi:hypothetical protein
MLNILQCKENTHHKELFGSSLNSMEIQKPCPKRRHQELSGLSRIEVNRGEGRASLLGSEGRLKRKHQGDPCF